MATTLEANNSYTDQAFKFKLYQNLEDRNHVFGYDKVVQHPMQVNYQNNYFVQTRPGPVRDISTAPKDYYQNPQILDNCNKAYIGPLEVRPNLYNDLQYPWTNNLTKPNLYKSWEPLSTANTDGLIGQSVRYVEHTPVELAANNQINYKTGDLNALLYERKIRLSADEQPYMNFNRRAAMLSMVSQNVKFRSDGYLKLLSRPEDAYAFRTAATLPAVTGFP